MVGVLSTWLVWFCNFIFHLASEFSCEVPFYRITEQAQDEHLLVASIVLSLRNRICRSTIGWSACEQQYAAAPLILCCLWDHVDFGTVTPPDTTVSIKLRTITLQTKQSYSVYIPYPRMLYCVLEKILTVAILFHRIYSCRSSRLYISASRLNRVSDSKWLAGGRTRCWELPARAGVGTTIVTSSSK